MADELWQALQDQQQRLMDPISAFSQSPIKGTFVLHFMLITWALITTDWMPHVFIYYNLIFFLCLFWSLHAVHNPEPVQLSAILNLLSILLDVMCIATNYESGHLHNWFGFSLFLLICNLLLRPITSIVLLRVYNDRTDRFGSLLDSRAGLAGFGNENYTPANRPPRDTGSPSPLITGVGHHTGGYQNLDAGYDSTQAPPKTTTGPYQAVPGPLDNP